VGHSPRSRRARPIIPIGCGRDVPADVVPVLSLMMQSIQLDSCKAGLRAGRAARYVSEALGLWAFVARQ
jgi:hypothetical protein